MTEKLCSYGKKYPCAECKEPCPEELKRREFYDDEPDWEDDDEPDWEDDDEDDWEDDDE